MSSTAVSAALLYDGRDPQQVLRYPPVEILHEVPGQRVWFLVPGMYGGFDINLTHDFLSVKSWSGFVGGSGQEHLITTEGAILAADGFDVAVQADSSDPGEIMTSVSRDALLGPKWMPAATGRVGALNLATA